jgi:hypothetical protein
LLDALGRLVRGLQAQNEETQKNVYISLVLLLKFNKHVTAEELLNAVNHHLTTKGDNTKGVSARN